MDRMHGTGQRKGYIYAAGAIVCWSTISTAFKLSLRYQSPEMLLLIAAATSLLFLLTVVLVSEKLKDFLRIGEREMWLSAGLGALNPFLYYVLLLKAYNILPAQEAQALNYLWAVMTVILSVPLLHKKLSLRDMLGVLISFAGAVIIGTRGRLFSLHFEQPLGVGLALATTVIWALYWLYNVRDKRDAVVKLAWNFIFGVSYIIIYNLFTHKMVLPSGYALLGGVYVGLLEMGITFVLWLKALSYAEHTARVVNLIFITPFLSLLIISKVLGESIALSTVTGLVLIVAGILYQQTHRQKGQITR